jgi:hypothetical protein
MNRPLTAVPDAMNVLTAPLTRRRTTVVQPRVAP